MVTIRGHFDGKVLIPDEPVGLPQNQQLVLRVDIADDAKIETQTDGLFSVLEKHSGSVEAPADWAAEHDHYLYGTPKRSDVESR